jgi:hypothetical protein
VDPVGSEPPRDDHRIAVATDAGDHDDLGVTEASSPALDQVIAASGVPEDGQGASEVEAARARTWTDDDQRSAASALVRLRDQTRAESSLDLASGELDDLLHSRGFVTTVAKKWLTGPTADFLIDFSAFLRPRQRRAAESLAEGLKKQDAAENVGRHRDTLHQWEQDPIFQAYVKQVEIRSRQERDQQRRSRQEALQANVLALCEDVVETLRPAVKDNPKVALAALSHLSKRILGS